MAFAAMAWTVIEACHLFGKAGVLPALLRRAPSPQLQPPTSVLTEASLPLLRKHDHSDFLPQKPESSRHPEKQEAEAEPLIVLLMARMTCSHTHAIAAVKDLSRFCLQCLHSHRSPFASARLSSDR